MIMTCKKGELGYGEFKTIWNSGKKIEVYVDGLKLERCFFFDDIKGVAKIYLLNEEGEYVRDDNGDLATGTISGKVEIKIVER